MLYQIYSREKREQRREEGGRETDQQSLPRFSKKKSERGRERERERPKGYALIAEIAGP
jgi:hypothetical protein